MPLLVLGLLDMGELFVGFLWASFVPTSPSLRDEHPLTAVLAGLIAPTTLGAEGPVNFGVGKGTRALAFTGGARDVQVELWGGTAGVCEFEGIFSCGDYYQGSLGSELNFRTSEKRK
jgi:hypothetical protein